MKKAHGEGKVVYIFVKKLQDIDELTAKQIEEGKSVCTQHMVFFTRHKSYVLCGDDDEELNVWKAPAIETLKNLFPESEIKQKRSAAKVRSSFLFSFIYNFIKLFFLLLLLFVII